MVRNPSSVRPWQHVLDPLAGYLWLGARLLRGEGTLAGGWNFGPGPAGHSTAAELVAAFRSACADTVFRSSVQAPGPRPHEAGTLKLDITKASNMLGWRPVWDTGRAVEQAARWYRAFLDGRDDPVALTLDQIHEYVGDAAQSGLDWAPRAGA